jgi:hypothetical protein
LERLAEKALPSFEWGQLLHGRSLPGEEAGDAVERLAGAVMVTRAAGDRHGVKH